MWQKIKNIYHFFVAVLANIIFLFPSRGLTVIGVTGTDGKTTTANLIFHILKSSGKKAALVSSVGVEFKDKKISLPFHVTTPSSISLQRFIFKAKLAGVEYLVLEVTSHSIDQFRIWGIPFKISVLTNVTNEHLDYHKTYDNYLKTKLKLLKRSNVAVVNEDDASYEHVKKYTGSESKVKFITYGLSDISDINPTKYPYTSPFLVGKFNQYNTLAAIGVTKTLGIEDKDIKAAVKTFKTPVGRFDIVYSNDFTIVIDFAHTPNSFHNLLTAVKEIAKGRVIHVFGSAGERDNLKRPLMGEISGKYSDIIVLTSEDPRSEDPNQIIEEIASGIKTKKPQVIKVADRLEAIEAAIQMAVKDDVVLITGKGHEKSINYGKGEEAWDEYSAVRRALDKRK